jgi:Transposase IS4
MVENMRLWTNKRILAMGGKKVSAPKFRAYIGLEIAMSILQMNNMTYYWKTEMFTGHDDFKKTMSHNDFQII